MENNTFVFYLQTTISIMTFSEPLSDNLITFIDIQIHKSVAIIDIWIGFISIMPWEL